MTFLDSEWSDWTTTTIDQEPDTPPEGGYQDSAWSAWVSTTVTPEAGWQDSDWSAWVSATTSNGAGPSGLYFVTDADTLVLMAMLLESELPA